MQGAAWLPASLSSRTPASCAWSQSGFRATGRCWQAQRPRTGTGNGVVCDVPGPLRKSQAQHLTYVVVKKNVGRHPAVRTCACVQATALIVSPRHNFLFLPCPKLCRSHGGRWEPGRLGARPETGAEAVGGPARAQHRSLLSSEAPPRLQSPVLCQGL